MELITLDNNFQPNAVIENYESLIWSERYSTNGDFEITSSDINGLVNALPRETYVSLRDSNVPMVVENHKLTKPIRDKPGISVTGRSFDTVLERRGSVNALPPSTIRTSWMIDATKESDAAYLAMRIVLGDIARNQTGRPVPTLPVTPPAVSPLDAIPELTLTMPADYIDLYNSTVWVDTTDYQLLGIYEGRVERVRYAGFLWEAIAPVLGVAPTGANPAQWKNLGAWTSFEIKPQNLYQTVIELIQTNHRGMKAVRPVIGETQVGIEIYNGADITATEVIDVRFDQIDDATYLLSEQGSTNVGYIYGFDGAQIVLKTTAPEPAGLARRVLILDDSGDNTVNSPEIRKSRGLIELYKYNATALFDGQVAEQIAAGYNRDYFLGDIVKLVGEYGLEQNARVAEFIRSVDSTGDKAYPTFEAVDD